MKNNAGRKMESSISGSFSDVRDSLFKLFSALVAQEEFLASYPSSREIFEAVLRARDAGDSEEVEAGITRLYCLIHAADAIYSDDELALLDSMRGYWCYAGGLTPIIKAAPFISKSTRLADFGAGNGLQGLLFQYLYPHRKTFQIELGAEMIERGKRLQKMMGIPDDRVEWIRGNMMDISPTDYDFIYIYRPFRPEGGGAEFYIRFARRLDEAVKPLVIFSVADCLKEFISARFSVFYDDGHLTCFSSAY